MACVPLPPVRSLRGRPRLPHDKSISHRALMLAAVAHGTSELRHLAEGDDVARTKACLQALGIIIEGPDDRGITYVTGSGPRGLRAADGPLVCGNSGTTMRLLMGLLAGLGIPATLTGDASLSRRPMARIAEPLRAMGAHIALTGGQTAPVVLRGSQPLTAVPQVLALASGQLKGALLLAGLHGQGTTQLTGALGGRDHTERLLEAFGARLTVTHHSVTMPGEQALQAITLNVPQDFSAAAFWLGASQLVAHADLTMEPVGLNPTRTGLLCALQSMGARMEHAVLVPHPEPQGRLRAWGGASLRGLTLSGEQIAPMIDELPLLMVLASQAHGTTHVRDAAELRVKETDRLMAMAENLGRMGARVQLHPDGCTIVGPVPLQAAPLHSYGDHRIAMACAVASMVGSGTSTLDGAESMAISDPFFLATRQALQNPPGQAAHCEDTL